MESASIQVLDRALDVLEALARTHEASGLTALARDCGLSKTTVHRILQTLLARGYVAKMHDGLYTVGPALFDTVSWRIDALDLQTEAKPHLVALRRATGLTSYLGVLDGPFVSVIEKQATDRIDEQFTQVGRRYPAHCSSMGKCLLACRSAADLESLLYGFELKAFTPNTITDKDAFVRHLRQVREQGWATDIEESAPDHRCVAAPVYDYHGDAIAVVGVSGTNAELPNERFDEVIPQVVLTGQRISTAMGYVA